MAELGPRADRREGERGFTLIEALVAILILVVGLAGVTNLIVLAADSNTVANQATAAVTEATETMEELKAVPFNSLVVGGDLDNPLPAPVQLGDAGADEISDGPAAAPRYNKIRELPGVGVIRTTWTIVRPGAGGPDVLFIMVRSESTSPMRGRRTRAEFSTFRTCTTDGCPI